MGDGYIRFDFTSVKHASSMHYYVLAESMDDMNQFLTQHGFRDVNDSLTFFPMDKCKASNRSHILHIYRFMSNHKPGVFNVMTCEDFITHAIETTANDLSDHCMFGEAILRGDIEFIKMISSMLLKLSHGFIFDHNLADESLLYNAMENDNYKGAMLDMIAEYNNRCDRPSEDIGNQAILRSLEDAVPDLDNRLGVYPITVEAYVSSFTELMIDCFN